VIGGYYYPPYGAFYDGWGWGYPYHGYPYGYGYSYRASYSYVPSVRAEIRLDVTPLTAQVFIDGYVAGTVDEFDGVFQRLRLSPGNHQITLYLDGYRTVTQDLRLAPQSDQKIAYRLEPLPAGERPEPPPVATERSAEQFDPQDSLVGEHQDPGERSPTLQPQQDGSLGTLLIRVQPPDADVIVDGEQWASPSTQGRFVIQLAEGRHQIEVRKDGFAHYQNDLLIRRASTLTLNVSLLGADGAR
jgi:hypothetical protein